MYFQITYISDSIPTTTSATVDEILEESRINNNKSNITGCLIYYNNKFIQLLEGNEESVLKLMSKIKNDKRHRNVETISASPSETRSFTGWGMAYYPIDDAHTSAQELEQFKNNIKLLIDISTPKTFTENIFWQEIKSNLDLL